MNTKQAKFIAAIAIQLLIIFAIIIFKVAILTGGSEVVLRIQPVDPRDPLRGDFVTFRYANISSIGSHMFNYDNIKNGDRIYIALRKTGKYHNVKMVYKDKPSDEELFIKGFVESGAEKIFPNDPMDVVNPTREIAKPYRPSSTIRIKYGIEEYFIPEGTGRNMRFTGYNNYAVVKIDSNGEAVIKQIYVDDKPWP